MVVVPDNEVVESAERVTPPDWSDLGALVRERARELAERTMMNAAIEQSLN